MPDANGAKNFSHNQAKVGNAVVQSRSRSADGGMTIKMSVGRQLVIVDVCRAYIIVTWSNAVHPWRTEPNVGV